MFLRTESFRDFLQFYPVVSAIIAFQVIIWLVVGIVPGLGEWIYSTGIGWNFKISQGEYWRLVTPIFLHAGFGHILFNSFSLILFAPALEQMLGKVKFLIVYFTAGIAANILTYIVEPNPMYTHVGASGAIFGLFGLYLFMVFFEKRLIDPQNARLILIISVIGLVMTFFRANINVAGHLFGFIAGFALGPVILRNAQPFSPWKNRRKVKNDDIGFDPNRWNKKRYRYKRYLKPVLFGILIVLVLLGFISTLF
ncbi:rhomboid family intramembrane serine protease [Gracilibacillus lacisalsi]|uniref:rhomboid family intramembrane serine protease n=1 Tax=Gracilibacillus lacisalsi TaxID=393087 RepID=UPI00035C4ED5|nr:rhomboid family intramembrane serine protease [Gracilibacillus lacisalsi]